MKIVTKFKEGKIKIYNFLNRKGVVIALSALINIFYAFTLFFFIIRPPKDIIEYIFEIAKETKLSLIINNDAGYAAASYAVYFMIILLIFVCKYVVKFGRDIGELTLHLISKKRKIA